MTVFRLTVVLSAAAILCSPGMADDWPQWLGPDRASEWREPGIRTSLSDGELKRKWRAECSFGFAGPAVAGGRVYLFDYQVVTGKVSNRPGQRIRLQGNERLLCLDAGSGKVLWANLMGVDYYVAYPGGPRATPTIDNDLVFTLGTEGDLVCRRTEDGEPVWHVDLNDRYGVKTPQWGHSSCPLVVDDLVYCMVGGEGTEIVAFNKRTGEEVWRALSASEPGYCSPITVTIDGKRQLIAFYPLGVSALDLTTGKEIWTKPIEPNHRMSIALPRVRGNQMFVSGGRESMLLDNATSSAPSIRWRGTPRNSIYCSNVTPYFAEEVIFGCDGASGKLVAIDPETADRLWEALDPVAGPKAVRRVDHGTAFIVRHVPSGRYFLFNELGELIVADLTREKFTSHGRAKLVEPTSNSSGRPVVWTHPAFAERCVFARNDKEIVCVDLAAE